MVKAMYCFDASSIAICQKPVFRSKQEKYPAPTRLSMASCIQGSRQESFLVLAFSLQKSMQKCRPLSFMCTNTIVLHHGLWLRQIAPTSSISLHVLPWPDPPRVGEFFRTSPWRAWHQQLDLVFARSVQPNSPGIKEKMLWYSANRGWVAAWFSSDHSSRPHKFSCWKSTSLHSTDIPVHWIPSISSNFSRVPRATSIWGTTFAATTWVALKPLAIVNRMAIRFFTMTAIQLLLRVTLE